MADQRRIDMKMSGKPEEEAWIQVINGKRANASGGFVKTKADLLKMKKYMGMVTQKVRDAYNKRLAELSKSKSVDSIDAIAAKYGHEVVQKDVGGSEDSPSSLKSAADVLKKSISMYKNGSAPVSAYNAIQRIRVRALELQKTSMDAVKYAKAVADECEGLLKKNGTRLKM